MNYFKEFLGYFLSRPTIKSESKSECNTGQTEKNETNQFTKLREALRKKDNEKQTEKQNEPPEKEQ